MFESLPAALGDLRLQTPHPPPERPLVLYLALVWYPLQKGEKHKQRVIRATQAFGVPRRHAQSIQKLYDNE